MPLSSCLKTSWIAVEKCLVESGLFTHRPTWQTRAARNALWWWLTLRAVSQMKKHHAAHLNTLHTICTDLHLHIQKKKKTPLTSSPQVVWEENTWNWASDVTNAPKCTCFEPTSSKPLSSFLKAVERRKAEGVRQRRYWHHLMKEQENIKSLVKKMHRNNTSWHWAPIHFYCSSRGDLIGLVTTAVEPMYETCFFYDYPI